ncbi:MAG: flagellar hook-associated protein FlgK [Proteobacteria bacterium]|nr:flagellar hook-associated protein FlgK [Pseudomonadota bacterium]
MSSLLNIGLTGLYAAQAQLTTTSHNISNAATPGYHRQSVQQSNAQPLLKGGSFFGQGTAVDSVQRSYSQYLESQVMLSDNRRAEYAAYNQQVSQIDNLLADPKVGLAPAMADFFAAVQDVSANPTNIASRQAMLSTGESLVGRFGDLNGRLDDISKGVDADIDATVTSINSYARQIAEFNQRIIDSRAVSGGATANDLYDLRDKAVAELNQLVRVTTLPQDDGSISVFIGNGQRLVLGNDAAQLGTAPGAGEGGGIGITLIGRDGTASPLSETLLAGGSLGGMLAFRREQLASTRTSLNDIATSLASAFNAQHRLGLDLDGKLGRDFFTIGGSGQIGMAFTDPTLVAAAGGVIASTPPGNVGSMRISDVRLTGVSSDAAGTALKFPSLTYTFNKAGNQFEISGASAGFLPTSFDYDPVRDAGSGATVQLSGPGGVSLSFKISGIPDVNADTGVADSFTLSDNAGGVADSRNAALLGALQTTKLMVNDASGKPTATLNNAYAQLVSKLGNKAREVQTGEKAQDALLAQAKATRDSVSGVNLDEEAANLVRFQQAYQASARVMSVAQTLFDTMLAIGR